jgi:hypothetical protein
MRIDRSLRLIPIVVGLALAVLVVTVWRPADWLTPRGARAQSAAQKPTPTYPVEWGRFVTAVYNPNTDTYTWYFEASDGTLRAVNRRTNETLTYQRR